VTDSGLETTLVFHERYELPYFAAFHLLQEGRGQEMLQRYFRRHASIAVNHEQGFVLESATWRASSDWGDKLGYSKQSLARANQRAIEMLVELRGELETPASPMVISGCVGPRGDGYVAGALMTPREAEAYHSQQIHTFAESEADVVTATTMTNTNEAVGVVRAAQTAGIPAVISFTVETDGRLPSGQGLEQAIEEVDAATDRGPAYYMINCAHPVHFRHILTDAQWCRRLRGLRANASKRSHAELDEAPDLDDGNPVELGNDYSALRSRLPWINVLGGCCGTDHRHIEQVSLACRDLRRSA
jgi:S-methylmethionine-dependent homocysteine/selenocysteine methylase